MSSKRRFIARGDTGTMQLLARHSLIPARTEGTNAVRAFKNGQGPEANANNHQDDSMLLRECAVLCDQLVQFEAGSRALGKAEAVQCAAIEIQGLRETQQKLDSLINSGVRRVARTVALTLPGLCAKKAVIKVYQDYYDDLDDRLYLLVQSIFTDFDRLIMPICDGQKWRPTEKSARFLFRFRLGRMLSGTWRNGGH